jgi:hypothetical protein
LSERLQQSSFATALCADHGGQSGHDAQITLQQQGCQPVIM